MEDVRRDCGGGRACGSDGSVDVVEEPEGGVVRTVKDLLLERSLSKIVIGYEEQCG
jgi:hypothetical protein